MLLLESVCKPKQVRKETKMIGMKTACVVVVVGLASLTAGLVPASEAGVSPLTPDAAAATIGSCCAKDPQPCATSCSESTPKRSKCKSGATSGYTTCETAGNGACGDCRSSDGYTVGDDCRMA